MSEHYPGWVNGIGAADARLAVGVLAASDGSAGGTALQSITGIRPTQGFPGQVAVKTGASPLTLTVNPFQAIIQDRGLAAGGAYLATLEGVKELQPAAAAATQDRIDLVVAEIDPSSAVGFTVHLVTGTPGNPPQAPAPNQNAMVLAQVTVFANGAKQPVITDRRTLTSALGGILPVFNAAARPAAPYEGMYAHRLDTNYLEYFDGARWRSAVNTTNTGWIPLALDSNWTPFAPDQFPPPQVRRSGSFVQLRGIVAPTVDFPAEQSVSPVIGTMPATMAPSSPMIFVAAAVQRDQGNGVIDGGWVQLAVGGTAVQLQFKNPQPVLKGMWVSLQHTWLVDDPNESP